LQKNWQMKHLFLTSLEAASYEWMNEWLNEWMVGWLNRSQP
jgi:hypothetical protein